METRARPGAFTGALAIAGYNWPFFAAAGLVVLVGLVLACLPALPPFLRWTAAAAAALAGWLACASFLAAHWVFDRSDLTQWRWLADETAPARWVHINAGLEETLPCWQKIFPGTDGKTFDIYDPESLTEPAIARARRQKAVAPGIATRAESIPVEDGWADAVFLLMTAHEIRSPLKREQFFHELARILAPRGKIVLVEHLRDGANALVFGPGALHFLPRQEWLRLAAAAGLEVATERRFTPFVHVFIYCHPASGTRQPETNR